MWSLQNPELPKINKGWFWPRQRWSLLLIEAKHFAVAIWKVSSWNYYRVIRCLLYLSILINLELIDLYLKGDFLWLCFCSKSYQIILKFSAKFCCTLPQLQASKRTKNTWIKSEIYMYSYFHAFKTINGNPYWPNCIWTLVTFLKLSPPFTTCNSQLQGHLLLFILNAGMTQLWE